ncbi:integral membrane protein [Colletotrichum plurivorum]|uniref:Integral membrane protein n=1 Tax=Colletotrichum plurivorum TaxID=2175906 RepID=A0A8H6JJL9_9PEZI|nr:integral membrane protein [Colletotrichum plurivorum]
MASSMSPEAHDDKKSTIIGSVVLCVLFPSAMVALRIYTRTTVIALFGVDDVLAILGLVSNHLAIRIMTDFGLGRHVSTLSPAEIVNYMHTFYISIVFYNIALLCIKLSFLFQYYRIMAVPRMRRLYAVAIVIVGAWSVSQLLIAAFQCLPVEGFWDKKVPAKCIPTQPQWYVNAAGNIITDVAIFALPLPIFGHLSLPRKQKLLLMGIFSLGFFTVAISFVRIKYLSIHEDFTWTNVEASLWSVGECASAVTCACLPTLRPLLTAMFPKLMARFNYSLHSHHTETRGPSRATYPTSAYPPKLVDAEHAIPDSAVSSARSSRLKDDGSVANVSLYQHQTASTEDIFGLASVREDAITPVRVDHCSLTNPRPIWFSTQTPRGQRDMPETVLPK